MLLPVALDASDASVVGSSLRLGVSLPDGTASGACFVFRKLLIALSHLPPFFV